MADVDVLRVVDLEQDPLDWIAVGIAVPRSSLVQVAQSCRPVHVLEADLTIGYGTDGYGAGDVVVASVAAVARFRDRHDAAVARAWKQASMGCG